jgi:hypothetical protein
VGVQAACAAPNFWIYNAACAAANACTQPGVGACCVGTSCTVTCQADCVTQAGTPKGAGTACSPVDPCAVASGVCCRGATCSTAFATAGACTSSTPTTQPGAVHVFVTSSASCNAGNDNRTPCCYANYNHNATLEVQDIFDFLNDWFAGKRTAIPGGDGATGTLAVQNIFDFLNAWFAGGCS